MKKQSKAELRARITELELREAELMHMAARFYMFMHGTKSAASYAPWFSMTKWSHRKENYWPLRQAMDSISSAEGVDAWKGVS